VRRAQLHLPALPTAPDLEATMIIHCQTCQADTILREGQTTCTWCGTAPARLDQPRPEHPRGPTPFKIREPDVVDAYRIWTRTTYTSVRSCANGLAGQFKIRGWQLRSKSEATAKSNRERSHTGGREPGETNAAYRRRLKRELDRYQPMCGAIVARAGRRRGQPCASHAIRGSDFCVAHTPERQDERARLLHAARRRSIATLPARHERTLERHARVVELRARGWSTPRIARETGYSPKSVATILYRARRGVTC
jgi:hypothetical protein